MSRQSLLDAYFKTSKLNVSPSLSKSIMNNDDEKMAKKRSLSLKKPVTPSKSPRVGVGDKTPGAIIVDLCSDDDSSPSSSNTPKKVGNGNVFNENATPVHENDFTTPPKRSNLMLTPTKSTLTPQIGNNACDDGTGYDSDSSQATIIYSPPSTPQTPRRIPQSPRSTPQITPFTPQTPLNSLKSPKSGKKYFSPIKKRAVSIKTPVRRNLAQNLEDCIDNNELFTKACTGLDDKTIFLLTIINKCIVNPSLFQLLDKDAQGLLSKAMHVKKPGMRLVCRLYWHKDSWYKLDKMKALLSGVGGTIDDPTLFEALNSLQECGFLTLGGSEGNAISFDEYTTILGAVDLKQICKELKLKISSKQDAIAALKTCSRAKSIDNFFTAKPSNNSSRVLKIMSSKAGPCYKLSNLARKTLYDLYILMYLGIDYNLIREKNLELTLLYDKIKRETYPVEENMLDDASVVFREREQFERYVKAHDIYEEYLIEPESEKKCEIVIKTFDDFKNISNSEMSWFKSLPIWLRRFTPKHKYVRILESGIQDLKKEKRFGLALEILDALLSQDTSQHHRADWYAEKALILQKCSRAEEAAKVLLEGFKSDLSEEDKDIMRPRAKIFAKQKTLNLDAVLRAELLEHASKDEILEKKLRGVHVFKQPMDRTKQKGKLKFETRAAGERIVQDVEEFCLSHYISSGEFTDGMHWEGKIVTTLFFLLFWDIIYFKPPNCPGVFLSRFQKYPLDLFSESFYTNRKELIEARLALIERCSTEEVLEIMRVKWHERPESELSGVCREAAGVRWADAAAVGRALRPRSVAALCRRLALGYRRAHSGFPDLTLWNTDTNQVRFVEVKSDTDKPSLKQIQWMHYLQRHGIDTEFCYVGANTTRCKARPVS